MSSPPPLPPTVHLSTHPCLLAKLSQLRSSRTTARDTKSLVHEITLILGCDALSTELSPVSSGVDTTPLHHTYTTTTTTPPLALIPILRSGLAMLDALQLLLPAPGAPVHHLGLYREPSTLQPVEYYNNLPYHAARSSSSNNKEGNADASTSASTAVPEIAILLDPIIATGGTSAAAIQTLLEWGVRKVVVLAVLGTVEGVRRAVGVTGEGGWEGKEVEVWVGGVDEGLDERGMIRPGVGDVGDRLFGTMGK